MRSRPFVIFWGAAAVATLCLGAIWSTAGSSSGQPVIDDIVLVLASVGLAAGLFIAGRIAFVVGRVQRREKTLARRPPE